MNSYLKCLAILVVSFMCLISLFGCGATVVDTIGALFGLPSMEEFRRNQQAPGRMAEEQELERKNETLNEIEKQNKKDDEIRDKLLNEKINRQLQGQTENSHK